jgi:hypothetical protein
VKGWAQGGIMLDFVGQSALFSLFFLSFRCSSTSSLQP